MSLNLEFYGCSGGFAAGFKQAGIEFDLAFDHDADACASYEANLGHKPVQMDVRDLLRMIEGGWHPGEVDLLLADPPCTPWSRAGKRQGTDDERDMLLPTIEIIRRLRPRAYLLGNVPGLDDSKNWPTLQDALAPLADAGYCIADFATLDAADYGTPQHRIRPFWFGHLDGPCIRWPSPTHGDPADLRTGHPTLPGTGVAPLISWVSCRQALGHLPPDELGRPVKLRKRACNSDQHGSVPERPARVVGTSNLSDGNVLLPFGAPTRKPQPFRNPHPVSDVDEPARTLTTRAGHEGADGGAATLRLRKSKASSPDRPMDPDEPARTVRAGHDSGQAPLALPPPTSTRRPKTPASQRPQDPDEPGRTVRAGRGSGQAPMRVTTAKHPPIDPEGPARTVTRKGVSDLTVNKGHPISRADEPSLVIRARPSNACGQQGAAILEWPWDRPSTTIARDERIPPPGHHDEFSILSGADAIRLSEKAAKILQGLPESWVLIGTKTKRWSSLGQLMPIPLAYAVATAVREQMERTDAAIPKNAAGR